MSNYTGEQENCLWLSKSLNAISLQEPLARDALFFLHCILRKNLTDDCILQKILAGKNVQPTLRLQ
jgi:hypothetical protein